MDKLLSYLRARRSLLLLYGGTVLVLFLVPFLSGQPNPNAGYSILLISFLFLLVLTMDGIPFYRRRKALCLLLQQQEPLPDALPSPGNACEEGYIYRAPSAAASKLCQSQNGL